MALAIDQYRGDCLEGSLQLSEEPGGERPQVVLRPARPRRLADTLRDMFLPQGYPGSVSDDYLEYQVRGSKCNVAQRVTVFCLHY